MPTKQKWIEVVMDYDWNVISKFIIKPRVIEIKDGKPRDIGTIWQFRADHKTGEIVADVEFWDKAIEQVVNFSPARLIPVYKRDTGKLIALTLEYGVWQRKPPESQQRTVE